jgi:hypothetical protein
MTAQFPYLVRLFKENQKYLISPIDVTKRREIRNWSEMKILPLPQKDVLMVDT